MDAVAIVGVGLIGGSFGLALRKAGFAGEIIGVSSLPAVEAALKVGAISKYASLQEASQTADLIYLAQPVDRILNTLEVLGPIAPARTLITDAGSTKSAIVLKAKEYVTKAKFVGGHPMAGKERRGADAAEAELFRNRPYVLTTDTDGISDSEEFLYWLQRIGANVIKMTAGEHDAAVALTSHLPQLLSTALSNTLESQNNAHLLEVFGPGLLDMTRLSLSSADLWRSILNTNRQEIGVAIDAFIQSLTELRECTQSECQLDRLFSKGAKFANKMRNVPSTSE